MADKRIVTMAEIQTGVAAILASLPVDVYQHLLVYGVPRGGVPVAMLMVGMMGGTLVDRPEDANVIVDDIYDSGTTAQRYTQYPVPFVALFDKRQPQWTDQWLVMPWEIGHDGDTSAQDIVIRLLQYIGEDPTRGGLKETPQRVLKYFDEITAGYGQDPATMLKVFEDGAEAVDEMVVVAGIPFYSMCEHHMAPFFGVAHIAYIPGKPLATGDGEVGVDPVETTKIVGLSKLARLLNVFARRLQVQERMTNQIADILATELNALGVGVVIRARHLCMESRGVQARGSITYTSASRGAIKERPEARSEFLRFVEMADQRTGAL